MSLTYIKFNTGSKFEPCGTPHLIKKHFDIFYFCIHETIE